MKTLLTSAALTAMLATGAAATTPTVIGSGTVHWKGSVTLPDMCEFKQLENGKMNLVAGVWTTDVPAKVTVAYRGVSKITVEADDSKKWQTSHQYKADGSLEYGFNVNTGNGVIHGHNIDPADTDGEVFDATVKYTGSTYYTTQDGGKNSMHKDGQPSIPTAVTGSPESFEVNIPRGTEFAGVASIEIHGTATPTGVAIYSSDDDYYTPHKITCLQ